MPGLAGGWLSSPWLFAPGLRLGRCPASSRHPSSGLGCTRARGVAGLGSPPKQVCNPAGMAMGCLCAPCIQQDAPVGCSALLQASPTLIGCFFAPFCTQGLLQGEGLQPKGGIWGCFPPPFAGGQLAAFPACSLERGRKSLLAGQTAKTQHRLLKGLYFYFFFKAPEKSPSVLPPFLPPPPPPPPAPVVPGAEPTRCRLRGKALPFEVA